MDRADAADAIARPAYVVAQIEPGEIDRVSRRTALDHWLDAPLGDAAERQQQLVSYLTT